MSLSQQTTVAKRRVFAAHFGWFDKRISVQWQLSLHNILL